MNTFRLPLDQRGAFMMEVLVTILVMSIGLLGVAAMQASALQGGNDSILRSKAVTFVADIADRMRGNTQGLASYQLALGGTIPNPPNCTTNQCTPSNMAIYDMAQWLTALQDPGMGLPGANAAIAQPAAGGTPGLLTITVTWTDRLQRNETSATAELYTSQVQL
jgi:type IV pilus assembly protein PilV